MMDKELCFKIENKNLYLEQVLVDYKDIPIFFLCREGIQYYAALCTDIDGLRYIVVKLPLLDVYNLVHGKIPMRDIILKQREYWDVVSGDEISLDTVTKKSIDTLEKALLPEENACFKILTKPMQLFVQKFDCELLDREYFCTSVHSFGKTVNFTIVVESKIKRELSAERLLQYYEKLKKIKTDRVMFSNAEPSKQAEADRSFKLVEPYVNDIAMAA